MKFLLLRNITTPGSPATLGELFLNGNHFAYTLEDEVRPNGEYVYSKTAIPEGEYRITTSFSNRFKKEMMHVLNVPQGKIQFGNRSLDACGIRIHGGNTIAHTEGCPLIGKIQDKKNNAIYNCAGIVQHMFDLVKKANEKQMVTLTIKNNYIMSA
jgi:hypothetical protein